MVICSLTKGGGLKSLLMKVKDESKNTGLKFNIQKTKILAFSPIISWEIEGEKVFSLFSNRFYFLGFPNHCRWWQQPRNEKTLAPWKKTYEQHRQHIKKQRHHFTNKGPYSQNYGFSSSHVQMWVLNHKEGWEPRMDAFKLWCWRRLLRVPWTARRSKQSIWKEINSEYSQEGLKLNLKLQYFWPPDAKSRLTGKDSGKDWKQT